MVDKLNKNLNGYPIDDEVHTDVGSTAFHLDHDTFYGGSRLEIWTQSNQSGTKLVEGSDYSLGGEDFDLTSESGENVYTEITIINGTYETGDLYITYETLGDYVDATDINSHSNRHEFGGNDQISQLNTSENLSNLISLDDLFSKGFVKQGLNTSIGSNANELDVTSGQVFVKQSSTGYLEEYNKNATTFTTSVASTTYYLDINEDGSYHWDTSHSTDTNYLSIAEVTTDSNGDISTITDTRQLDSVLNLTLDGASSIKVNDSTLNYSASEIQTALENIIAANVPFDDTNFGADTAAVSNVYQALNLLSDSAVVDEGSTADGDYIRYENGWQICFGVQDFGTYDITDSAGSVYKSPTFDINFPVSFAEITACNVNVAGIDDTGLFWVTTGNSTTNRIKVEVVSPSSLTGRTEDLGYIAIGRWK